MLTSPKDFPVQRMLYDNGIPPQDTTHSCIHLDTVMIVV